ncbi:YfbM family protein [Prosthecobacter sp.]|uniref:YfbM family protein n=1 Tax=Prosthecobacter sp. TaxID=1965333 RepID=UPI003783710A
MIGHLVRIPEETRVLLHAEPEKIEELLYSDFEEERVAEDDDLDIDKTWHVLHFLFTGFAWDGGFPAGFLLSCGEPVGDVDVGYGPARSFTPREVKQISQFLTNLKPAAVRDRLKPALMKKFEIYPGPWKGDEKVEEEWPYFEGGLEDTIAFVREAAEKDLALLVYIG